MAIATYDTQQGATITLGTDSLTLRLVSIGPVRKTTTPIRSTTLAATAKHTWVPGELLDYEPVVVTYQNSPGVGVPTHVAQTITITGPVATGGSVAESITGTGFVTQSDDIPGFSSETEGLQMKQFTFKWDGGTGPTRTSGS